MDSEQIKQNIKLGAFVVGGLLLFFTAIMFMGKQSTVFSRTFTVSAVFKNVEGLKEGDAVWLSGVRIGTVDDVNIIEEGKVIVNLLLRDRQNQFIRKDATATIGSDGLVGNKIVVVRPGTASMTIHDHDTIKAFSPTDTQEIFNLAREVGQNTKRITSDLQEITNRLKNGEGIVGELVQDKGISVELKELVRSLHAAGENTRQTTSELQTVMHQLKEGNGVITKLIYDSSYATSLDKTLVDIQMAGSNSRQISSNLNDLIQQMNSGDNALRILLTDSAFATKLRATLTNTKEASAKLDENMEALQHNFLLRPYFRRKARKP